MQMDEELRNCTGVYQQTRGGANRTDIFGSNLFNIINQDQSKRTGGDREWANSRKPKRVKFQASNISLFGWGGSSEADPEFNHPLSPSARSSASFVTSPTRASFLGESTAQSDKKIAYDSELRQGKATVPRKAWNDGY